MTPHSVTINSRKYDQHVRRTWTCELVERDGPLFVFVGVFDEDIAHPGLGEIKRGTISYEYYWLDRWYNVFRFHEPDGAFRNYYCNINQPPTFEADVLDYVDLDIDILVWADWSYEVIDRTDFEKNRLKYGYPPEVITKVEETILELIKQIEARSFPFDQHKSSLDAGNGEPAVRRLDYEK